MASCPPELLEDLAGVLAEVRDWPGVVERKPGVFYVRNQPFLHFHLLAGGGRRADVKGKADWVEIGLGSPITAAQRRALLAELRARHAEKTAAKSRRRE